MKKSEMHFDPKRLSVTMITMNEEAAVSKVIQDIHTVAPGCEILLVDSSRDRTAEIAESLGAKVIKQFPPQGYGPAMELALRSSSREVVITLDCDDTYPVERIPEFWDSIANQGFDLVDGSRLKNKPNSMPWFNYLGNYAFALLASILSGTRFTDLHSGMRAYRKKMIDQLSLNSRGAALPVELLLLPLKKGYKIKSIFIDYKIRIGESTMKPLESAWWTLKRIFKVQFS